MARNPLINGVAAGLVALLLRWWQERQFGTVVFSLQRDLEPDNVTVQDQIAIVAAVGHRMSGRPGVSGQIFAALGQAGINIRMINQGPAELNIIFGVENKDFKSAIRVLYDSFVK